MGDKETNSQKGYPPKLERSVVECISEATRYSEVYVRKVYRGDHLNAKIDALIRYYAEDPISFSNLVEDLVDLNKRQDQVLLKYLSEKNLEYRD